MVRIVELALLLLQLALLYTKLRIKHAKGVHLALHRDWRATNSGFISVLSAAVVC